MCGIAGCISAKPQVVDEALVRRLDRALRHRGPDDSGILLFGSQGVTKHPLPLCIEQQAHVMLLHRRLSILDLGRAGWQPMSTPEGRYHAVYNGEVYNFLELRRELKSLGHCFRSQSDTEVILAAYAQWGTECLRRFTGMFAMAIFDVERRSVLLARDFFGIKPLYYTRRKDALWFASEIKVLLEVGGSRPLADSARAVKYLREARSDDGSATFFRDIYRLPPGHYLDVSLDRPEEGEPVRFWSVDAGAREPLSFDAAADRLRHLFVESVRLHLRSDVPVAAALSGGIDSSSIVSVMRSIQGQAADLHTFSYVADDATVGEEEWIDLVSRESGTISHRIRLQAGDLKADLQRLIAVQEEPFGSTSIYAQHRIFQSVSEEGIKVVLDGQGADEFLGGYRFFLISRMASLAARKEWLALYHFVRQCTRLADVSERRMLRELLPMLVPARMRGLYRALRPVGCPAWMREPEGAPEVSGHGGHLGLAEQLRHCVTERMLPHLLRYQDRNSMAFGIESRVPFLTPEIVEFTLALPEEYIIAPDGTSKAVFRRAMHGIVPKPILERRDKIGFSTPEGRWLRQLHPWIEEVLASEVAESIPYLNAPELRREWNRSHNGSGSVPEHVWRCVNYIQWAATFNVEFA